MAPADSLIPQLHPSPPSRRPHLRKQFKVIEEIGYNCGMRDSTRSQRCKKVPHNESQNEGRLVQADPLALTADIPTEREVHGLRKPIPTQSGVWRQLEAWGSTSYRSYMEVRYTQAGVLSYGGVRGRGEAK